MIGSPITPELVLRRRLGVQVRRIRGRLLVKTGPDAFELEDVAMLIFTAIDGQRSIADIAALAVAEYGIDIAEATQDAVEFIGWLAERGLVELPTASGPR
ncbi:MAG: PqqD family protein [Micromonosporaceae bacterium]